MPSCAVATCKNTSTTVGESGVIFHPFPRNEKEALAWFIKCRRNNKKRPNAADRICSEHFQPSDYEKDIAHELLGKPLNPKLKYKATPTLNLPYICIKPSEARKILPPSLARQLSRSELHKSGTGKKQTGPPLNEKTHLSSESKETDNQRRICIATHCQTLLEKILADEDFMDVTLVTENKSLKAHKAVLSQASSYFKQVLSSDKSAAPDSEVKISDVEYEDLMNLITFIYRGEVHVKKCDFSRFHEAAKTLQIYSLLEELNRIEAMDTAMPLCGLPPRASHHHEAMDSSTVAIKEIKDSTDAHIQKDKLVSSHRCGVKQNKDCTELKNGLMFALSLLY